SATTATVAVRHPGHGAVARACPTWSKPGIAQCAALFRVDATANGLAATSSPTGWGPGDLESAYGVQGRAGFGRTVAIVGAGDYPNAESDMAVYRNTFGLPACTSATGCFTKVNQTGGTSLPAFDLGWSEELSLDIDMVSAICPDCHILVIEAT